MGLSWQQGPLGRNPNDFPIADFAEGALRRPITAPGTPTSASIDEAGGVTAVLEGAS